MSGPTVPVSGPEDGARERVDLFGPGPRPTVHSDQSWSEHLERQGEPVVADTTAGEAEDAAVIIDLLQHVGGDPDLWTAAQRRAVMHLAARSGSAQDDGHWACARCLGTPEQHATSECIYDPVWVSRAQDDGLRERIEALAEDWERYQADLVRYPKPLGWGSAARALRRALAGPDDAWQDGAR